MLRSCTSLLFLGFLLIGYSTGYPSLENAIQRQKPANAARTARRLVHQANWAAVGTISLRSSKPGYPMVSVISIDDSIGCGKSTGRVHFFLTDWDYPGQDWRASNKVTFLVSDEQNKNCEKNNVDPMEPSCARAIISGKVREMDKNAEGYNKTLDAFVRRHPSAKGWPASHGFYLCELDIESISVMGGYGGYKAVTPNEYYQTKI